MSFALKVAHKGSVALICKAGLEEANTYYAQGGIASVTNLKVDNFEKHIHDTMVAGDWISDPAAVEKVICNAPSQIEELIKWGVNFDKKDNGEFDLHKEGGHSEFRILHHKDNTGAEIQTSLIEEVKRHPNITVFSNFYAVEIITQHHLGIIVTRHTPGIKCFGAYVLNEKQERWIHSFLKSPSWPLEDVKRFIPTPPIHWLLQATVLPWYIVPKELSRTWSLYNSTLLPCIIRATVPASLSQKLCEVMEVY